MSGRRTIIWSVFTACVVLVIAILAWVTHTVVRLERAGLAAGALNAKQQLDRLALWRMDSAVAPIISREAARPYFHYRAEYSADRPFDALFEPAAAGETMARSPLLEEWAAQRLPFVRLHFQLEPDGRLTSPQVPSDIRAIADPEMEAAAADAAFLVEQLRLELTPQLLARAGQAGVAAVGADEARPLEGAPSSEFSARQDLARRAQAPQRIAPRDVVLGEPGARESSYALFSEEVVTLDYERSEDQTVETLGLAQASELADADVPDATQAGLDADAFRDGAGAEAAKSVPARGRSGELAGRRQRVVIGPLAPAWLVLGGTPELVLTRIVRVGGLDYIQGVWLDWESLRADLLALASDLTSAQTLAPILDQASQPTQRLATIPVAYSAVAPPPPAPVALSPARLTLLVTWLGVVAAAVAIAMVLRASYRLVDRRGRFVSAVTHELRTPLTTFRLYSQMLADGMVSDEQARKEYLETLKRESGRLSGIVENVLEYARLSRRAGDRKRPAETSMTLDALLVRLRPALSRRAEQAGMDLIVSSRLDDHGARTLTIDPQSVERILMNLVENAIKYAGPGDVHRVRPPGGHQDGAAEEDEFDPRIHLDASVRGDALELLVADYGPGIPQRDRARVFGEFQRGRAVRADRSGLGLGLALSRGLARESGGDLVLARRRGHGAEFLLTLPLDPPQRHATQPVRGTHRTT